MGNFKSYEEHLNEGRGTPVVRSCVEKKFNIEIYHGLREYDKEAIQKFFEEIIEDTKRIKKGFNPTNVRFDSTMKTVTDRVYSPSRSGGPGSSSTVIRKQVDDSYFDIDSTIANKWHGGEKTTKKLAIDLAYVSCKPVRLQIGESSHSFYASFYDREDMEEMRKALNANFSSLMTGGNPNVKVIEAKVSDRLDFFDVWLYNRIAGGKADEIMTEALHHVRGVIGASTIGIL